MEERSGTYRVVAYGESENDRLRRQVADLMVYARHLEAKCIRLQGEVQLLTEAEDVLVLVAPKGRCK